MFLRDFSLTQMPRGPAVRLGQPEPRLTWRLAGRARSRPPG